MKRKLFAALLCLVLISGLFPGVVYAGEGDVEINATNFPDENFRNYIKNSTDINPDGDEVLTASEISYVDTMNCSGKNITSLQGVEYFTELVLLNCNVNPLKSLDVSRNKNLTELQCSNTQLTVLDVSSNTALEILNCAINSLKTLNLANNKSLEVLQCEEKTIS